jgi:hypothetical protein
MTTAEIGLTRQCARDHHDECWLELSCECECHADAAARLDQEAS